jgi:hypothetical protein
METNHKALLVRWQKACLAITVILSVPYILALVQSSNLIPIGDNNFIAIFIGLIILWCPLVFHWIGLQATSSILASILGMLNVGAGLYGIFTPEYPKLVAVGFLLAAVFYYFYSTNTWQAYEIFWLNEQRQRTGGN